MANLQTAVFGGGCFWCTEAIFSRLRGVKNVESGYTGGSLEHPTYEQVSAGNTGHVEAVKIDFDPGIIKYSDLLNVFFATHDPTTLNRQGDDSGEQYRSVVFYADEAQRQEALDYIKQLSDQSVFTDPIVTELSRLEKFYPAESHHRRYYDQNQNKPYCQFVISPKIAKLRAKFSPLLEKAD